MKPETGSAKNLLRAAILVFAAWTAFAILTSRCLYADGSHEFVKVLKAQNFDAFMWSRHFAFYIFQFPLVLAIKLGVTDFHWLRFAFGLGCYLPWPLIMLCCYWLSPKNFWLVVVGCAAGYLNANFMAVGEHILAHALFWPALFVILFARPLKPLAAVILLAMATGLLFSYESQLFLCLTLAALTGVRLATEDCETNLVTTRERYFSKAVFFSAFILFVIGALIGLYALMFPELPGNYVSFFTHLWLVLTHPGWTLAWTIAWFGVTLAAAGSGKVWEFIRRPLLIFSGALALAIWGFWPLLAPRQLDPTVQYDNRVLDLIVPLLLLPVALIVRYRPFWLESKTNRLAWLAAVLLLVQSVWQISATARWQTDINQLQTILRENRGVIPLHGSPLAQTSIEGHMFAFDWTWPCLSIALTPDRNVGCLIISEWFINPQYRGMRWQPFDPLQPADLPDLSYFGINYTNYVSALQIQLGQLAH